MRAPRLQGLPQAQGLRRRIREAIAAKSRDPSGFQLWTTPRPGRDDANKTDALARPSGYTAAGLVHILWK